MTAREKMNLLKDATSENVHEIKEHVEDGVIDEVGRPVVRLDIRAYIRRRLQEEGVSEYKAAEFLGKAQSNFSNFMSGRIPMPLRDVERLLWVLDGKAWIDEDTETRIIKQ